MRFPDSYLVYDLETTGLDAATCEVIEIGARLVRGGQVRSERSWLIRQANPLPEEIVKLTGITDAMLAGGVDAGKAFRELASLAGQAEALVGHNIMRYDNRILERKAIEHGVFASFQLPVARSIDTGGLFKAMQLGEEQRWDETLPAFCLRILERVVPVKYNLTLTCETLGIEKGEAHRAAGDVAMAHAAYLKLVEKLYPKGA